MPDFATLSLVTAVLALAGGYVLGSVPYGVLVARVMGLGNLRDIGSGNIGATNVLRTGNKLAAFLTLVFDAGKGVVAVVLARVFLGETGAQLAGLGAFLGHIFPVWLGFRGGKGVATFLGILLALNFLLGAAACLTWLVAAVIGRMSSAAALVCGAAAPALAALLGYPQGWVLSLVLAVLVWWTHRANIRRILTGTEPKIGQK